MCSKTCGVPDVPHAVITQQPSAGTEGSSVGLITAPPVISQETEATRLTTLPLSARVNSNVKFVISVSKDVDFTWQCKLLNNNLLVDIPAHLSVYGSKDSFVALLEYAETGLAVEHVIVRLIKDQKELPNAVRLFMFFGFVALPPTHPLLSTVSGDSTKYLHLAYKIDS
ncbi:hypothetical protein EB796_022644 [Bugula neritina]|uniref:Ornithine decarboxylase antizyme n=1 Tax=Bugula neritina TaxID=10212 RepID=A0A7J7IYQ6_BUGNE|nr:hypothetical protein EB796_022644 [Bugula neritina]